MQQRHQPDPETPDGQAPQPHEPDADPGSETLDDAARDEGFQPGGNEAEMADAAAEVAIDSLREELDVAKDRALRVQAELENYRKRVARERADEHRYANIWLLRDLLPVVDNLERAIAAAERSHEASPLLEGMKLIRDQLAGVLAAHHCVPIEAQGEPFDPHRHEAILQQPSDEAPANMVVQVTQTGYRLHDRVVRPAQVIVSAGPKEEGD